MDICTANLFNVSFADVDQTDDTERARRVAGWRGYFENSPAVLALQEDVDFGASQDHPLTPGFQVEFLQ